MTFKLTVAPFQVPLLPILLSIVLAETTLVLDWAHKSRSLTLFSPLLILIHHLVTLVPRLSGRFSTFTRKKLFTVIALGAASVIGIYDAFQCVGWYNDFVWHKGRYNWFYGRRPSIQDGSMRGCLLAEATIHIVQVLVNLCIVYYSIREDERSRGAIALPDEDNSEAQPILAEGAQVGNGVSYEISKESPLPLWFLLLSSNISGVVLFLSALDKGKRSHHCNIAGPTVLIAQHLVVLFVYMDKVTGSETQPLFGRGNFLTKLRQAQAFYILMMFVGLLVCGFGALLSLHGGFDPITVVGTSCAKEGYPITRYNYVSSNAPVSVVSQGIFAAAEVLLGYFYFGHLALKAIRPSKKDSVEQEEI